MVPVSEAVREATAALTRAQVDSARSDALVLAAHVLGVPRSRLVLVAGFTPAALAEFRRLVADRARRVPLQHLTGVAGFGRLELAVGPGVFVPRPETELLAQWALTVGGALAVDLASGSGALALALAHGSPATRVVAVERSPAAVAWLRRNAAARAAAGDRPIEVVVGDATDPRVLAAFDGTVDLVVSNPPYVPEPPPGDGPPPEVADHDPPEAVFAGPDGLAVIRPLAARAAALLRPGGWFGLEHDETQPPALPALLSPWFAEIAIHRDLTGRPRYVTARRVAD